MAAEKTREGTDPDAGRGLLQAALDQVIDVLWASLRCSRASVMLADGEGEKASLGVAAWRGDLADEAVEARVGSGTSISGSVFASARVQRVDDTDRGDPDPRLRGEGGSFICMPLPLDGRLLGVVNVSRPRGETPFSADDERVLHCLSLFAGKAIQAAQLAYLLNSGFAQRALESERGSPSRMLDAFSQGTAQPAQVARLLAKSFYREMKAAGFGANQIVGAAGEIIDQLSVSLRKHGRRISRTRQ
jgi:L-methionine (R)-S-oxide reductase